ncbi:MAG: hypothetical protein ACO3SO_04565 [Luteolibacter sp.]
MKKSARLMVLISTESASLQEPLFAAACEEGTPCGTSVHAPSASEICRQTVEHVFVISSEF